MSGRPAVFLDRDGTLIEDPGYLGDPAAVRLLPGAAPSIARLNAAGLPVIVVTNQSGIGRGLYDEAAFRAVQRRIEEVLAAEGARIDGVYHCPHAPGIDPPCDCRKPAPGLFRRAAAEHGIDLARSYFVGDRVRDVAPCTELGGTPILIGPAEGEEPPADTAREPSLETAVDRILGGARS